MAPGPVIETNAPSYTLPADDIALVEQRLRDAGLNESPALGDKAVAGHLARLEDGEVGKEALLAYADNLMKLNEFIAANGALIPPSFWDLKS